jgi:hypothetical protein
MHQNLGKIKVMIFERYIIPGQNIYIKYILEKLTPIAMYHMRN